MKSLLQTSLSKVTLVAAVVLGLNSVEANAAKFRTLSSGNWGTPAIWEKQDLANPLVWASGAGTPGINDDVQIYNGHQVTITNPVIFVNSINIDAPGSGGAVPNGTSLLNVGANSLRVYDFITLAGTSGSKLAELRVAPNGTVLVRNAISPTYAAAQAGGSKELITGTATQFLISQTIAALPVELVSFKAVKNTSGVSLTWETASEKNNTGFEVQSSTDGKNYERIGFVASVNGTSSSLQRYAFTDKASNKEGLAYYRLKQIDLDGTFEFFTAKVVDLGRTGSAVSAYPNPFQNQFAVNLTSAVAEAAVITVTDMTGKTVYTTTAQLQKGTNTLNVTLKDQPAGIYMLNATAGNQTYINRLVKQ